MNGNLGLGGVGGGGGGHIFITTFMKRIQFCNLTGNEKENSSQIYQTRAQTVSIYLLLFPISVVLSRKVTKCNSRRFEHGINLGGFRVGKQD